MTYIIIDEVSEVPGPRRMRRLAREKRGFPYRHLPCGQLIRNAEDQKEHRRLTMLGPSTCKKMARADRGPAGDRKRRVL